MTSDDHNLKNQHLDMPARSYVDFIADISKGDKIVSFIQLIIIGIYDVKSDRNG